MSTALESFELLCQFLSFGGSDRERINLQEIVSSGRIEWLPIVALANKHFLTPALHARLRHKGLLDSLPDDLKPYLDEVYRLNTRRNWMIRNQAQGVVQALNDGGIVPMVLKGGIYLFDNAIDHRARMMIDFDLLVSQSQFDESVLILQRSGYAAADELDGHVSHARTMMHPERLVTIDLHRTVGRQRSLLGNDEIWRAGAPLPVNGLNAMAPSPTHRVLHSIFHGQIQNRHYVSGTIQLQQIYDLTTLCQHYRDSIDWAAVKYAMNRLKLTRPLSATLTLCHELLGAELPAELPSTAFARWHLSRCKMQLRYNRLMRLSEFLTALTYPFARFHTGYIYDCDNDYRALNATRMHHALLLVKKYGRGTFAQFNHICDNTK